MRFFRLQGQSGVQKKECWAYDDIYFQLLPASEAGEIREEQDNDRLPQINLALLFGEIQDCHSITASSRQYTGCEDRK